MHINIVCVLLAANLKSTFPIAASALALAWSKALAPKVSLDLSLICSSPELQNLQSL